MTRRITFHLGYLLVALATFATNAQAQYEALMQSEDFNPRAIAEKKRLDAIGPLRLVAPNGHTKSVLGMQLSDDGKYLATFDQDTLKVWDTERRVPFIEKIYNTNEYNTSETIQNVFFTSIPEQLCIITSNYAIYPSEFILNSPEPPLKSYFPYKVLHAYDSENDALYVLEYDSAYDKKTSTEITLILRKVLPGMSKDEGVIKTVSLPTNTFDFNITHSWDSWKLSFDTTRQKFIISFVYNAPSLMIDLTTEEDVRLFPKEKQIIGYLPNGKLLSTIKEGNNWQYAILASDSLEVLKTMPVGEQKYPPHIKLKLPRTLKEDLLLPSDNGFIIYDVSEDKAYPKTQPVGQTVNVAINLNPEDSIRILAVEQANGSTRFERFDPIKQLFKGDWVPQAWTPKSIYSQGDTYAFAAVLGKRVRLIGLNDSGLYTRSLPDIPDDMKHVAIVAPNIRGKVYYVDGELPNIAIVEPGSKEVKRQQLSIKGPIWSDGEPYFTDRRKALVVTPDGRYIAAHYKTKVIVYDTQTDTIVAAISIASNISSSELNPLTISSDGARLLYGSLVSKDTIIHNVLTLYDTGTQKNLWQKSAPTKENSLYIENLQFTDYGRSFVATDRYGSNLTEFSTLTGEAIKKLNTIFSEKDAYAYSPKGTKLNRAVDKQVVQYSLPEGKLLTQIRLPETPNLIASIGGERFLLTHTLGTSSIQLIDTTLEKIVADIFLFDAPEKWLIRNPETGLFTSNDEAHTDLFYVRGDQINPLEAYFDQFYRPKLMGSLISGLSPKPKVQLDNLRYAPRVMMNIEGPQQRGLSVEDEFETIEIGTETVTLKVLAQCEGTPIKDIRIYQNGKLVTGGTRGLFVEDDDEAQSSELFTREASFTFPLAEGKNRFRAISVNDQETESIPDELIVYSSGMEEASSGGMKMHLFVIGINEYTNPEYNLNYAQADADAVEKLLKSNSEKVYTTTQVYSLRNAEATRDNIIGILENIKVEAKPRDAFVFYFAGHGTISQDEYTDFYLAPTEMRKLYGERMELQQNGISSFELLEYSRDIAAQKQLFLLDACQSEGALKTVAQRGAAEEEAIAQLARSTGTHWLTATGSEQFATEFEALGHGTFTYTLLEALTGKADTGDGIVSVNELKAYIEAQVPEVTEKYKGEAQYPASYGYGQDFPLSIP